MKVLSVRVPAPVDGMEPDSSPWVRVDHEHIVIALIAESGRRVQLQLLGDAKRLRWFDSGCFLTADSAVPSNWVARVEQEGTLQLAPRDWLADGFWEKYYGGVPEVQDTVERDLAFIVGEVGAITIGAGQIVGVSEHIAAGQRLGEAATGPEIVVPGPNHGSAGDTRGVVGN